MITTDFTKDFQIQLLTNLTYDEKLLTQGMRMLTVEDFDIASCQLIYEALVYYYRTFKSLPPITSLSMEVADRLSNSKSSVQILPEEYEALATTLDRIANAKPETLDAKYYEVKLLEFIKYVRASRVLSTYITHSNNPNMDAFLSDMSTLNKNLSATDNKLKISSVARDFYPITSKSELVRIQTGQRKLDAILKGGLIPTGLGMVTACPGVGKTTTLINFAHGATVADVRTLFITLELTESRIMHRYQGIAAGISTKYFDMSMLDWPDDVAQRYSHILSPKYPFYDYMSVVDMSKKTYTVDDINGVIEMWIDEVKNTYGDAETSKCKAVYIDWLDKFGPDKYDRGKKGHEIYPAMLYRMGDIARNFNVSIWTATQGKQEADGREYLGMNSVAGAYHKNDALDVGIGIGILSNADSNKDVSDASAVELSNMTECSRKLSYTVNKNRDGITASVALYQGPTLKLYDSQFDYDDFMAKVKTNDMDFIFGPSRL